MLSSIHFKSGYPTKIKGLKNRTFEFTDKVNILFGQNGCGKTTILKCLAAYTGINQKHKNDGGGWFGPPSGLFLKKISFPKSFEELTPGKCTAEVGWDGWPVFYNSASLSEGGANLAYFCDSEEESPDGMMSMAEQVGLITGHYSEGELRLYKLSKVVDQIKKQKLPYVFPPEKGTDIQKKYAKYVFDLVKETVKGEKVEEVDFADRKITLLWDEPDRSLSIENQIKFWTHFIPNIAGKVQVVIASHSYFPLFLLQDNMFNIIDIEKGYIERNKKALVGLMGTLKENG